MRTTPEAIDLQATFRAMLDAGDAACAMEVSSHALELRRVDGVRFAVAAFTNLSQDHLDFHPDMENYFAAKERLFREFDVGVAVVVVDDEWGRRLAASMPGAVGVSIDGAADWSALTLRARLDGTSFTVRSPLGTADVELPLRGRFNAAERARARWRAARRSGCRSTGWRSRSRARDPCRGASRPVDEGQDFAVLVDYAHKPGALEKVLASAREVATGRVVVVFGAGGDRDTAKRPVMGEIAARMADAVIVTSDNPRSEDPEAIVAAIIAGVPAGSFHVKQDRRPAGGDRRRDRGRRAGRRRRHRRQGPRAGAGVRRRPQGALRRRRGGARRVAGGGARVRDWNAERVAGAAGADLLRDGDGGPSRVVIDSRSIAPGDLFVAIPGERVDGGRFAADALRGGRVGRAGRRPSGRGRSTAGRSSPPTTPSRRWAVWPAAGAGRSARG